ncbi:UvrD-helicase domain-containing protein [Sulfobacillus harzensis]|nr:UvrD-helicase domain-containing protein [Sulfobacillus harzensis]
METIDRQERAAAVEATFNVLVEAGAGTGKTSLLINRVMHAIDRHVPLSRMLLITFMEKAADEMRSRLQARLLALGEGADHQDAVERAVESAAITTIHGFCYRILQEFGPDYGIPIGFQVLDEVEAARLWEETFQEWVQDSQFSPKVLDLLHAGITYPQLKSWARRISHWREVPVVEGEFPELASFVRRFAAEARAFYTRALEDAAPDDAGRGQILAIAREFDWLEQVDRREWPRMLALWTRGLGPKGNQKNWAHPEWLKEQKQWLKELKEALGLLRQQMADAYLKMWLDLVGSQFMPLWRRARFEKLALTYDDLLIEAERITREPKVQAALSRRFSLVMVDEFQDTDPLQAAIVRRLVTPPGSTALSPHDQGRLFLVGDPKQSIYRFRGADVETYAAMRQELSTTGGRIIPIWQNFRSNAAILAFVNRWFSDRWPSQPDLERPYVPPFQPLAETFPDDGRERVRVIQWPQARNARDTRRMEALDIAERVAMAVAEGWPVRTKDGQRPLTFRDIALVVPQRTEIDIYRQALRERGIPVSTQSGRSFFQQDEVRGMAHLFRALEMPQDSLAVVGWLLSPWVAMSHEELLQHRRLGGSWDYRETRVGSPEVREWMARLNAWHREFWRVDAEDVIIRALHASPLVTVLREREDKAALANLDKLRSLARDLGDRWTIFEFTQWLYEQVHEGVPFEEAPVAQDDDAVAISTVHQAKGLEWPLVIVANWKPKETYLESGIHYNSRLGRAALKQDPWQSRDWDLLEADHRLREEAEGDRLLYVALTRAKDYLWFYAAFLDPIGEGEKGVSIGDPS